LGGLEEIVALTEFLADAELTNYTCENVVTGITKIYMRYPETRGNCASILAQQLSQFVTNKMSLNPHLELAVDFTAVESVGLIEQAYQADHVDEYLMDG
jgi:hypothetical protein